MENIARYVQIVMLVLFYATMLVRSLMLYLRDGINPFVLGRRKTGFNAFMEYAFCPFLLLWSYEVIAAALRINFHMMPVVFLDQILGTPIVLQVLGMILAVAGYIVFMAALLAFGQSWRIGIDKAHPGKLTTHGIFAVTRNPIFLYLDLYFLGTALLNPNLFFILSAAMVVPGIHYQIRQEEKFLTAYYGQAYLDYQQRVGRYF